jgi:hypothetical protein
VIRWLAESWSRGECLGTVTILFVLSNWDPRPKVPITRIDDLEGDISEFPKSKYT